MAMNEENEREKGPGHDQAHKAHEHPEHPEHREHDEHHRSEHHGHHEASEHGEHHNDHKHYRDHEHHEHRPVRVIVNTKEVTLDHHEQTGLQIKEAAIKAGVKITVEFVLFHELMNGQQRDIQDDQRIHVHEGEVFEAIRNDDNS